MTQKPGLTRRIAALERWQQDEEMQAIIAVEPRMLIVLQMALEEENIDERWFAYEALKQRGSLLVGWYCDHPALQTERHYDTFIKALDECLPDETDREKETAV